MKKDVFYFHCFYFLCALFFSTDTHALEGLSGIDWNIVREYRIEQLGRAAASKENELNQIQKAIRCRDALLQKIDNNRSQQGSYPVQASWDLATQSIRVEPVGGVSAFLGEAQGRVLFFHGLGMSYSGPNSYAKHINTLTQTGEASSTAGFIQSLPTYLKLAPEAIDLPGSLSATPIDLLYRDDLTRMLSFGFDSDLGPVIRNIAAKLRAMRLETPHLPIYIVARSAYGRILPEVNYRYPGLIDKMVIISPTYPGGRERDAKQLEGARTEAEASNTPLEYDVIDWFFKSTAKINWNQSDYFRGTPTLFLTGSEDTQVLNEDRKDLERLSQEHPYIRYINLPGAKHDVFDTGKSLKKVGRQAWTEFF